VKLYAAAVEMKTIVGRELERANTEWRFGRVYQFAGEAHSGNGV